MNRHFLNLVKRGKHPAASSGERAAHLLAAAISQHAPALDDTALEGAVEFLRYAWSNPHHARDLAGREDEEEA